MSRAELARPAGAAEAETAPGESALSARVAVSAGREREAALAFACESLFEALLALRCPAPGLEPLPAWAAERLARCESAWAGAEESEPEGKIGEWLGYAEAAGFDAARRALLELHCGDCCAFAFSCSRCWAERFFGLDTAPGKLEGRRLWARIDERRGGSPERGG